MRPVPSGLSYQIGRVVSVPTGVVPNVIGQSVPEGLNIVKADRRQSPVCPQHRGGGIEDAGMGQRADLSEPDHPRVKAVFDDPRQPQIRFRQQLLAGARPRERCAD
jgi:hypothetical protein